ncbi:uncharacterized protein ACOB8E_002193 [Sarcophilus harrisii]
MTVHAGREAAAGPGTPGELARSGEFQAGQEGLERRRKKLTWARRPEPRSRPGAAAGKVGVGGFARQSARINRHRCTAVTTSPTTTRAPTPLPHVPPGAPGPAPRAAGLPSQVTCPTAAGTTQSGRTAASPTHPSSPLGRHNFELPSPLPWELGGGGQELPAPPGAPKTVPNVPLPSPAMHTACPPGRAGAGAGARFSPWGRGEQVCSSGSWGPPGCRRMTLSREREAKEEEEEKGRSEREPERGKVRKASRRLRPQPEKWPHRPEGAGMQPPPPPRQRLTVQGGRRGGSR